MTTKPKVQKFRVRRGARTARATAQAAQATAQAAPATAQVQAPADQVQEASAPNAAQATPSQAAAQKPAAKPAPKPTQAPEAKTLQGDALFDNAATDDGFGDAPFPGSAAAEAAANPTPAPASPARSARVGRKHRGVAAEIDPQTTQATEQPTSDDATAKTGDVTPADELSIDEDIDKIRREGLTGRQLRMARRVAQKHGIAPISDFDAVRQLRKMGIDPFKKAAVLDLVDSNEQAEAGVPATTNDPQLPKTVAAANLPAPEILERIAREKDISSIQQDIARRRRRKLALLGTRLAAFVGIPTILAGIYFYTIATPMYVTNASLTIQQAQSPSAASAGGLGSLLSGSPLGTSAEAVIVQDYLLSKDAMIRLDQDAGFKDHFSAPSIDPIQRLAPNPTNEQAYKAYKNHVEIGYDPTEGIIKMEVIAADPQVSKSFSEALITYAEERMDQMTQRVRDDQMAGARESLDEAEVKMQAAQDRIVELQEQMGIISPDAETQALMGQINGFETQLQEKRLQRQQLLDNQRPNQARVDGVEGDIRRLTALIAELRSQLTEAQGPQGSLARITAELRMAEVELQTRQAMAQQALQSLETARVEVNRQVAYLTTGVSPVAPEDPSYPRKFENTLLAFLIFSGIYLMASLTAAVLREQVSA